MAALSTSNVTNSGLGNGLRMVVGQFTGSLGDASATLTVGGTNVYGYQFIGNDTDHGTDIPASWSMASGIITFTISSALAVTDGTFHLIVR